MEKQQYDLCIEVLGRLHKAGVLKEMILIGSWCVPFYKDYFDGVEYRRSIRTRDVDILIPHPEKVIGKVSIPELLKDLGFVVGFRGAKGYVKLEHPDLMVEFLVPEKGKGGDHPVDLPGLGINATALRYLHFLCRNTISVEIGDLELILPHPANFALHKLIIFQRRRKQDKATRDREMAINILKALISKGDVSEIRELIGSLPKGWQADIKHGLEIGGDKELITELFNKKNV